MNMINTVYQNIMNYLDDILQNVILAVSLIKKNISSRGLNMPRYAELYTLSATSLWSGIIFLQYKKIIYQGSLN